MVDGCAYPRYNCLYRASGLPLYDTSMLLNLAKNDSRVQIAEPQFKMESYGIAFALNSPLWRPVNDALLWLIENGTYDDIYKKYFSQV